MTTNILLSLSTTIHLRDAANSQSPAPCGNHFQNQLARADSCGNTTSVSNTAAPARSGIFSTLWSKLCRVISEATTWVGNLFTAKSVNQVGIVQASSGMPGLVPGGPGASSGPRQWDISDAVLADTQIVQNPVKQGAANEPVAKTGASRRNKLEQLQEVSRGLQTQAHAYNKNAKALASMWRS